MRICPGCGRALTARALRGCPWCGKVLQSEPAPLVVTSEAQPAPISATRPRKFWIWPVAAIVVVFLLGAGLNNASRGGEGAGRIYLADARVVNLQPGEATQVQFGLPQTATVSYDLSSLGGLPEHCIVEAVTTKPQPAPSCSGFGTVPNGSTIVAGTYQFVLICSGDHVCQVTYSLWYVP